MVLFYFLDYVQVLTGGGSMMKIQGSPVSLNPIEKSQDLTDGGFWQEKKGKRKLVVKMPSFKKKKMPSLTLDSHSFPSEFR